MAFNSGTNEGDSVAPSSDGKVPAAEPTMVAGVTANTAIVPVPVPVPVPLPVPMTAPVPVPVPVAMPSKTSSSASLPGVPGVPLVASAESATGTTQPNSGESEAKRVKLSSSFQEGCNNGTSVAPEAAHTEQAARVASLTLASADQLARMQASASVGINTVASEPAVNLDTPSVPPPARVTTAAPVPASSANTAVQYFPKGTLRSLVSVGLSMSVCRSMCVRKLAIFVSCVCSWHERKRLCTHKESAGVSVAHVCRRGRYHWPFRIRWYEFWHVANQNLPSTRSNLADMNPDWTSWKKPGGKMYYYNTTTKTSTFNFEETRVGSFHLLFSGCVLWVLLRGSLLSLLIACSCCCVWLPKTTTVKPGPPKHQERPTK